MSIYLGRVLTLAVVLFGLAYLAQSRAAIVDPISPPDELLDSLAGELDQHGVDVRRGVTYADDIPSRPQLARLASLTPVVSPQLSWSHLFKELFEAGASPNMFMLAAKGEQPFGMPSYLAAFQSVWNNTLAEKKIFISFAGADAEAASAVSQALRNIGYLTFTYKKANQAPLFNAVEVGEFFKSAGNHLVIDSSNARTSEGVAIEALGLEYIFRATNEPVPVPSFDGATTRPWNRDDNLNFSTTDQILCCEKCIIYPGGVESCTDMGCGPQCQNARSRNPFWFSPTLSPRRMQNLPRP